MCTATSGQDRGGKPMPKDYVYKLWLAHGITTVRDPGSTEGIDTIVAHARLSAENKIAARPSFRPPGGAAANTPDEAHALHHRRLKQQGALGLQGVDPTSQMWKLIADEAKRQGLPIATDMKLQGLDALGPRRDWVCAAWRGFGSALQGSRRRPVPAGEFCRDSYGSTTTAATDCRAGQATSGGRRIRRGCRRCSTQCCAHGITGTPAVPRCSKRIATCSARGRSPGFATTRCHR